MKVKLEIVVGGQKFDHVSPILSDLHWLSIEKRVVFKIATLMFKCVNGLAPHYIANKCMLKVTCTQHNLRSCELNFLIVPSAYLVIGSRNCSVVGRLCGIPFHILCANLGLHS